MRTGSIVELTVVPERPFSTDDLRNLFRTAARTGSLEGIVGVLGDEWTSARASAIHTRRSST